MNEKIYLISYEVNEAQFDYSDLKEVIKSLGDYQHPMEPLWFVKVQEGIGANEISDKIKAHFHSAHDHVFVMQVEDGIPRQGWLPKSFWKWLKQQKEI